MAKFTVFDRNAVSGERQHDMPGADGKITPYIFKGAHEGLEMSEEEANRFLGNDGFEVFAGDGTPVLPVPDVADNQTVTIAAGQTVAWLEELTQVALFRRASKTLPAGVLHKDTPREKMIELLNGKGSYVEPVEAEPAEEEKKTKHEKPRPRRTRKASAE